MHSNTRSLIFQSLFLALLFIVLGLFVYISQIGRVQEFTFTDWYSVLHPLSHVSPLSYIVDLLKACLAISVFALACLALGLWTLQRWINSIPSHLAVGVTAFILGEIIFSVILLSTISIYRLTPSFTIISFSLAILGGFPVLKEFAAHIPRPNLPRDFRLSEKIILTLIVSIVILSLLYSSARLSYDAVTEYFSHAKIMAISRLPIFFYFKDSFVVSSFHPGILFTAIIQVFGDQSARLLSWANGVAILLMGLTLAQEVGLSSHARLWFLVLLVTSTAFVDLLGDGKIELISTAPILAAIYWMLRSFEQPSKRTFLLIGLLAGFAIISRPYNIFLVSLFVTLFYAMEFLIAKRSSTIDYKAYVRAVIWLLLPIFILGIFHLLANWFFLKSPIAPLTYARSLSTTDWQWQFDPRNLIFYRLLYPLVVTFLNSPQSLGNISPLFVCLSPLLLVKKVRENLVISSSLWQLCLIAVITLILWIALFFTVVEIRYIFFLWVILFLVLAQIVETSTRYAQTIIRSWLRPISIALLIFIGIRTLVISFATYSPVDPMGQAHCYDIEFCTFLEPINQTASPGDRVLVLNAFRYYLRPDLFACSSRWDEYAKLEELAHQNSPEFWVQAYRQGYRFVAYEKIFAQRHSRFGNLPDLAGAPPWLHLTAISSINNNEIGYLLEASNPPIPPEITCKQDSTGIWQLTSQLRGGTFNMLPFPSKQPRLFEQ